MTLVWLWPTNLAMGAGQSVQINLSNGDRITGEILDRHDGKIYFHSPYLGDLVIPETDAAIVELPDTPVEALAGLPPKPTRPTGEKVTAPEVSPAELPPSAPAKTRAAVATPAAPLPPATNPEAPRWKGKVEFGFAQKTGRTDAMNMTFRADAEKTKGPDNLLTNYRYLYGEQNDVSNSDRIDASFRWRHDLTNRVFSQFTTGYYSDDIARIDHNIEQNASLGYKIIERPRHIVNVGAGLTARYRDDLVTEGDFAGLGEIFEDYAYKINGRLTFAQNFKLQYSPEDRGRVGIGTSITKIDAEAENYKIIFNSTLQGKMTERISMNLRFEYEFDNAIATRNAKTDQRITSSLGYAF